MSEETIFRLIQLERQRQIDDEGYSPFDDDQYHFGELNKAALCYELREYQREMHTQGLKGYTHPKLWPWHRDWWKPTPNDRIRELTKAGALYMAECERLKRKIQSIVKQIAAEQQNISYNESKSQPYH